MILLLKNTNQLKFIHLTLRTISNFLSQITPKAIKTIDLDYNQMDIDQAFSSESDEGNHSLRSEGRDTVTTQSHRDDKKTKNIKKKYQPIVDGGKVCRFEDDPAEYKRLRKYQFIYLGKYRIGKVRQGFGEERRMLLIAWSKKQNI